MEALSAERGEKCIAKKGSLRWNARKLLEMGEVPAIREIADRLDGKVTQGISGHDGGPIRVDVSGMSDEQLATLEAALGGIADASIGDAGDGEGGAPEEGSAE